MTLSAATSSWYVPCATQGLLALSNARVTVISILEVALSNTKAIFTSIVELVQHVLPQRLGYIEVLLFLIGHLEEPGNVLENEQVPAVLLLGCLQLLIQPPVLLLS